MMDNKSHRGLPSKFFGMSAIVLNFCSTIYCFGWYRRALAAGAGA